MRSITSSSRWTLSGSAKRVVVSFRTCGRLRPLANTSKWGNPYFDLDGAAVTKWFCAKNWINVYFFRGRELPDPHSLFQESTNSRMLTVKVNPEDTLDRSAFRDLVRSAAALAEGRRDPHAPKPPTR